MPTLPVSLQLWSVREDMKRDFASTVAEVARIGYAGVELAGYGNLDSKGAKAALDAANLKVSGMHVGIAALRADPEKVIGDALMFGSRHVTVPFWSPDQFVSIAAVEKIGVCTYPAESGFFSFRRATHAGEPDYGRQISAILLTP